MKTVKFIKNHPAGILKGKETDLHDDHAKRLAEEGYVQIIGEPAEDPIEPEFFDYTLTKADIQAGTVGIIELEDGAKKGDVIKVPNPKYKQFQ